MAHTLPCPRLTRTVDLASSTPDNGPRLPAGPGVFAFERDDGQTITLAISADVRRRVRARLSPPDPAAAPSRRIDYRSVTRRVRALPVGSSFEADWAYLQLARERLPATFRQLLDRWQAWCVHVDPSAEHPRFVKMAVGHDARLRAGMRLGPLPDKHAAQRAIEMAEDLFDLCRYHHILVQAPSATACAYKEMGRCPAPCDGSIPMTAYREAIVAAARFLEAPIETARAALASEVQRASAELDFETAGVVQRRWDVSAALTKPAFRHLAALEDFRKIAWASSERAGWTRVFVVSGGWIEPWADIADDATNDALDEIIAQLHARFAAVPVDLSPAGLENIGLVVFHLFRPAGPRDVRWTDDPRALDRAQFRRHLRHAHDGDIAVAESSLEE